MALAHFSTQGSDAICASLVFCLCDISGASSISIAVELPSAMMSPRGCARERTGGRAPSLLLGAFSGGW